MNKPSSEEIERGTVTVLMDRAAKIRIPKLLKIKEHVDTGAVLNDSEFAFLREVLSDMQSRKPLYDKHPELHSLAAQVIDLYHYVTEKAAANEMKQGPG